MGRLKFYEAIATLVGTIIGAGIFGIPYVIAKAGFLTGVLNIIVITIFVLFLYLYMGEIVLRTKGKHQLTGYCERYLGKWGKRVMAFSMVFGVFGALTAYLMGEGSALSSIFGGSSTFYMVLFFIVVAALLYFGLEVLEESELFTMLIMVVVVLVVIFFTFPSVRTSNLMSFDIKNFFVPYGVVLFAFLGMTAVPEMHEILEHDKKRMKKALYVGIALPAIIYIVFSLVVVGSVGLENFNALDPNHRIATIALAKVVSPSLFMVANILAVFTMFTSFMALGYALKEMFMYDYGMKNGLSWALTCFIPLGVALSNITNFIQALNIVGVVVGCLDAILIVLMFHKAKKIGERIPEYEVRESKLISIAIVVLFVAGAVFLLI